MSALRPIPISRLTGAMSILSIQRMLAFTALALSIAYCLGYERSPVCLAYTSAIFAGLLILCGRLLTASVALVLLIAAILGTSMVKNYVLQVAFHSSDILLLSNWDMQRYLWRDQLPFMAGLSGATICAVLILALLLKVDLTRVPRLPYATALIVAAAALVKIGHMGGDYLRFNFTGVDRHLSNFYGSFPETAGLFKDSSYFGVSQVALAAPHAMTAASCERSAAPPNIILIHQEAMFPPSIYPEIEYAKSADSFFRSLDGKIHLLRVETFGSGSWLTEFSVLSGLSSASFRGVRSMAPAIMTGKLGNSLPQRLKECGYKNIEFNPLPEGFAFAGNFHRSIGIDVIYDKRKQGATRFNERDKFYYDNVLRKMHEHFTANNGPLFTYIITMAGHYPYNFTYEPSEKMIGGRAPQVPFMNEYLRRLGMASADYQYFVERLQRDFPDQKFLVVHYGDHQPNITEPLFKANAKRSGNATDSIQYITYYAVDGIRYQPPTLPDLHVVDIPYLSSLVPFLAQLPLSRDDKHRLDLMYTCGGQYADCPDKSALTAFHEALFRRGSLRMR